MAEKLTEKLTGNEKTGLVIALLVVIAVSVSAGYFGADNIDSMITGLNFEEETEIDDTVQEDVFQDGTTYELGEEISVEEVESKIKELIDQEMAMQQEQMTLMAAESEELDEEDIYIDSEITEVVEKPFESLYQVTISITGEVPSQMDPEETEILDEEDIIYISNDGNFLFMPPQDLESEPGEQFEHPEELGEEASEEEIEQVVTDMIDDEMAMQQEQFDMMAAQDDEIEEEDFQMEGKVTEIEQSVFQSLYRIKVLITGEVPSQTEQGETDHIEEESELLISMDGRYIFMPPQDASMLGQQPQMPDDFEDELQ